MNMASFAKDTIIKDNMAPRYVAIHNTHVHIYI